MNTRELYDALMGASKLEVARQTLQTYRAERGSSVDVAPFGRPNNQGTIDVATDAARSAIERVTNAHDALLELAHQKHAGKPDCRSPREAAHAWFGVPVREGLAKLSGEARRELARQTVVRLEPGEGWQSRILTVEDRGIGILPEKMTQTILSLNESNKIQKHYLAGTYGQGGSSTLAFCTYALIASRAVGSDKIAFTVAYYQDLPPEEYKTGRFVYLVEDGKPFVITAQPGDLPHGTIIRHFGYDLTRYTGTIGPQSLYGALQRVLFDPVAPVFLENRVAISEKRPKGWNRVIKGVRNALNGAVDQEDDDEKGPDIDHHSPLFNVSLGDLGDIGIEYWVLKKPPPDPEKKKKRSAPSDSYVDSRKPIVLTHNGQNQGELSALLIRKDADLPYLRHRMICHVSCDRLTPMAKRQLFSSTREHSREGAILKRIQEELVRALLADDELTRLNVVARDQSLEEQDETAKQQMRRQVAKLLRIAGAALVEVGGGKTAVDDTGKPVIRRPRPKPEPIALKEPPTYIRMLWEKDKDIPFYAGQRRYIRVETDANSQYQDRINVALGDDLKKFGTSPLQGGRMRVGIECKDGVALGSQGSIRVELYRQDLPALADEKNYEIVKQPERKDQGVAASVPEFEVIEVSGPEDERWDQVADDPDDTNVSKHACNAEMNAGTLYVYFSAAFPRFATEYKRLEQQDGALAESFKRRYKMWIAVHALLMHQQQADLEDSKLSEEAVAELTRQERCRLATIATMIASQEAKSGLAAEGLEAVA